VAVQEDHPLAAIDEFGCRVEMSGVSGGLGDLGVSRFGVDQGYQQRAGTTQVSVAQLLIPIGSAPLRGDVMEVPDRFEGHVRRRRHLGLGADLIGAVQDHGIGVRPSDIDATTIIKG
jgi:hypothetical protein